MRPRQPVRPIYDMRAFLQNNYMRYYAIPVKTALAICLWGFDGWFAVFILMHLGMVWSQRIWNLFKIPMVQATPAAKP